MLNASCINQQFKSRAESEESRLNTTPQYAHDGETAQCMELSGVSEQDSLAVRNYMDKFIMICACVNPFYTILCSRML